MVFLLPSFGWEENLIRIPLALCILVTSVIGDEVSAQILDGIPNVMGEQHFGVPNSGIYYPSPSWSRFHELSPLQEKRGIIDYTNPEIQLKSYETSACRLCRLDPTSESCKAILKACSSKPGEKIE